MTPNDSYPIEISIAEVKQLKDANESIFLVDCRESQEHEICRIEGATLIPMNQTPAMLEVFSQPEGSRVIIFCHHGIRSLQVASYLRSQGIDSAQSMAGGIDQWSIQVDDSVPRY